MKKIFFPTTLFATFLVVLFSCANRESDEKAVSDRGDITAQMKMKEENAPMDAEEPPSPSAEEVAVTANGNTGTYNLTVTDVAGAMSSVSADKKSNGFISSSAAVVNQDSSKKFIRTSEMKFRVKDVLRSTLAIEDVTKGFNGFVTYTHLGSEIVNRETTSISADSSLETIYFVVTNHMTVRVPNKNLDTALRSIAKQIDYLDYRTIKADDITLSLLANSLQRKRLKEHSQRLTTAIDERGKKLSETTEAEESLLNRREEADNTTISTLDILDKVAFSTITIDIYQIQSIKRGLIENYKNTKEYEPSFISQVGEGLNTGWNALVKIFIALINIWPLLVLAVIGWFVFKRYTKK